MPTKLTRVLQIGMSPNYGGTEAVIYEIYRNIDRTRIQFDFLNVYDEPLAKQDWLESLGARIFPLKLKRREGHCKYLRGIKAFYKTHAHEFDAVVCNVQCLDQIDMAKYAKKFGIRKTIVHLHNADYGIQPSLLAKIAVFWNKWHCHRYVDQYVACSALAAKWGYSNHDAKNCCIFKQGIDSQRMRYDANKRKAFRQQLGYTNEDVLYGSVGRMDPQKNQRFLIDIYTEIGRDDPRAKFLLVGTGPMAQEISNYAAASPITNRLLIIPKTDDIDAFYSGIDCFILPSKFEGLGMVLIEAQCAGLPCLATKSSIPEETKISDSFVFLPLEDGPSAWAKAAVSSSTPNRANSYIEIINAGRDVLTAATDYATIIL